MLFADVILPLALPKEYTYAVPENLQQQIRIGQRVIVQFAAQKLYSAIVYKIHPTAPENYEVKNIESILDDEPIVNAKQLLLWEWLSEYYMCSKGEVLNGALPAGLKLTSETNFLINTEFGTDFSSLNDDEFLIAEALQTRNMLTVHEACEILNRKKIYPVIKSMLTKKAIHIEEELKEKYKPKIEQYVRLKENLQNEEELKKIFSLLEKAPKQLELLMLYVQQSKFFSSEKAEVKKVNLQKAANASAASMNTLVEKNIFEVYEKEVGRWKMEDGRRKREDGRGKTEEAHTVQFNAAQREAFNKIKILFAEKNAVLLHGVTSSGKTEIYIGLIEEVLAQGKQVLYLLPEIALTTQIISRLIKHFGNNIGVYHSRFNSNERVELWNKLVNSRQFPQPQNTTNADCPLPAADCRLILGARSALFLPFSNLGLIIIDEEHETSFKQFDPAPRYHARDAALMLAKIHSAKTLLGSATPAIETYFNAKNEKYGLVELTERFGGIQLPEIIISDIKEASRKKIMKSHFSPLLMDEMQTTLKNKEQIILFQNRRGFAPFLQCETCNTVPQCRQCDVKLTYHKRFNELRCHYCGYKIPHPKACMACGDVNLKIKGFGTEKIEEELAIYFPDARIARLDLDTTRSKNSYRQIISDFEEHNIDILVGTQMVTKGLDFDLVALVGILNADTMLHFPDFRAHERSFQLMAQVAGRSGRKNKRGKVIVQTYSPNHPIIQQVIHHDYSALYNAEIAERNNFNYPPFCRLVEISIKHKDIDTTGDAADFLANNLRKKFGNRIIGPEFPLISRVKNRYIKNILLKIEKNASPQKAKEILTQELRNFKSEEDFKQVRISVDVDKL